MIKDSFTPPLVFLPPVIAHRGARSAAPENTLSALRLAREQGASWVEVDVKLTHDGVPVLMHDDTLDRTTNSGGPVADTEWIDIGILDAGSWFAPRFTGEPVPRLADAVRTALDCGLNMNIEIKPCAGRAQATAMVSLIEIWQIWPEENPPPLISSFNLECLRVAAQLQPHWPRGLLLEGWHDNWRELVENVGASTLNLDAESLTRARVETLRHAQLPVLAYTVNDPARAKELLDWGVSAVFSDNPKEVLEGL